jgi:ATP-dependent protease Clp ATPase subunit
MDAEAAADAATKLPELKEPERDQEAISEERNRLTNLKGEIEAQLTDLEADNLEVKLPPALKEEKKLNVLLIGPPGCGKTVAANYMA